MALPEGHGGGQQGKTFNLIILLFVILILLLQLKFEYEDKKALVKKLITVQEYFSKDMNYTLKFPHLPCLHLGSPSKNIYIPVELCELKSQTLPMNKKLGDEETQAMIKATAIAPVERKVTACFTIRITANVKK